MKCHLCLNYYIPKLRNEHDCSLCCDDCNESIQKNINNECDKIEQSNQETWSKLSNQIVGNENF